MSSSIQDTKNKEVIREYYMFLYHLASEKNYEHSSQMTDEEKRYCEKLLSQNSAPEALSSNEVYLSLLDDILEESIRRKNARNNSSR